MIKFQDLSITEVYKKHAQYFTDCANWVLSSQNKQFVIDDYNRDVIRFLLYYFNGNRACEGVFPQKGYKLGKQIVLYGTPGVGKTVIMESFSVYLKNMHSPVAFENVSLMQMMNYFHINDNIDRYTFNAGKDSLEGKPFNICMNDIGVSSKKHFGIDPKEIVEEFLMSRDDIFVQMGRRTYLTTNLDKEDIKDMFYDEYGRLTDRMLKTYNFIPLLGESRR